MAGTPTHQKNRMSWGSPLTSLLHDNRNTELTHKDALAAAQAEHERVREHALRVYHTYEAEEQAKRIQEKQEIIKRQQQAEEQRIRREEQLRAEEERLRALKAKVVPPLPPPPPPPPSEPVAPAQKPAEPSAAPKAQTEPPKDAPPATTKPEAPAANGASGLFSQANGAAMPSQPQRSGLFGGQTSSTASTPAASSPFSQPAQTAKPNPFASAAKPAAPQTNGTTAAPAQPLSQAQTAVIQDRYVSIHQNLKKLRASIAQQTKTTPQLKARLGDMRRELRKNMGQLVGTKGGNKQQVAAIQNILRESLSGSVPSALVDPHDYISDRRDQSVENAQWNEPQLPSLFLYLLNQFSKAIINQFVNECGAQPRSADPVGVVAAMIFSNPFFLWRGKSLVDILMAKLRIGCPVLFGYRGNEKTEQGRIRLGWRKDGPGWIPEQAHIDRMKGLGVGYAAISMRDFSRSQNTNPWPPRNYWTSLARILNTPGDEISNTQCVVVRAMLETYEERFIGFYGSQAIAAMRKALIEFPARATQKTPGVLALQVLPDSLKRDLGLDLS